MVGVPVGFSASYPPILGVDRPVKPSWRWWSFYDTYFNVESRFHGMRGSHGGLRKKLDDFLISQVS